MSYIIKAVLANPNIPENGVASIPFPLSGVEYDHSICEVLGPMGIGSAVAQDCMVEDIDSSYDVLGCLKGQMVNVDELDYLAKRLDSFDVYEAEQFQASCAAFGCADIRSLINMTFCSQETTVISDFAKLDEAGKAHYLTTHGGVAPTDEIEAVDGKALAEQLIQSGNREPLIHCAVFLELTARDPDKLRTLKDEVMAELTRSKLGVDNILLRQQEGFRSVNPAGANAFGGLFERVLPATSVGNLYPFNYSGKTDPKGFYVGRDKYGSNIIVDLDRRAEDKTTGSALILGNSGQGKSYLLKLLLCNILEGGKSVICLDPEHELEELTANLGGCFIDLMGGQYRINPLEPKLWDVEAEDDQEAPVAFRQKTLLSQHISFLKDFFRSYKDFQDRHIDTIELMLDRLYAQWGMTDQTDFSALGPQDYPILSDLYATIEAAYQSYDSEERPLYTKEMLQEILLGLHSMCKGAESRFFNGHTNITSDRFLVFGVKGLLQSSRNVKDVGFSPMSYTRKPPPMATNWSAWRICA